MCPGSCRHAGCCKRGINAQQRADCSARAQIGLGRFCEFRRQLGAQQEVLSSPETDVLMAVWQWLLLPVSCRAARYLGLLWFEMAKMSSALIIVPMEMGWMLCSKG